MVTNVPNTRTGGAARIMHYLRDELTEHGHQVDLLFAEDVPNPLGWCGLGGVTFPALMLLRIFGRRRPRYDIVAVHTLEGAVYAWLRKNVKRLPKCVIVSYGADELRWELEREEDRLGLRRLGLKSKLFYYNLIIRQARYAARHGDHIITAARAEKGFYQRTYGRAPEDVTFIPNGVGREFFIVRDYHRKPTKLLFVGGWEWRKGTRYLVEAFSRLGQEWEGITLSLVGTGMEAAAVKRAFPTHLHSRIHVVPWVAAEDAPNVYANHDIFVFPSMFESMSLAVPEAMASGLPIVTTRACGMQDIIEDGVTGFLVPPRDAETLAKRITELLNDPLLCSRLGQAAQKKAREITWDKISCQTLQLYERLLNGPSKTA